MANHTLATVAFTSDSLVVMKALQDYIEAVSDDTFGILFETSEKDAYSISGLGEGRNAYKNNLVGYFEMADESSRPLWMEDVSIDAWTALKDALVASEEGIYVFVEDSDEGDDWVREASYVITGEDSVVVVSEM